MALIPENAPAKIRAVFLDVGETIVNESALYGAWADWLGVPRHTFSAVLGAVIARGANVLEAFRYFDPGFDLEQAWRGRTEAGLPEAWGEESLYPDARPCLQALQSLGLRVGLAGNQTREAEALLASLHLPLDVLATSHSWGVEKPSAGFFARVLSHADCGAASVLYVGDRLDNDIAPAQQAGMATAFLRRGPWGYILRDPQVEARCLFRLATLAELPSLLRLHNAS
ncbi:MAG: HAD family hydrolase [Actinomycetota bacterium]